MKKIFSLRLRELREKSGLTQAQLAKKLNKSESTIRMWELDKNEPDNGTISQLAEIFKTSTDYLLGNTDNQAPAPTLSQQDEVWEIRELLHKRPEMKTLFSLGKKTSREDIEKAIRIIEALNPREDD